jgi:hypothetical protein
MKYINETRVRLEYYLRELSRLFMKQQWGKAGTDCIQVSYYVKQRIADTMR